MILHTCSRCAWSFLRSTYEVQFPNTYPSFDLALHGSTMFNSAYHLFRDTIVPCGQMVPKATILLDSRDEEQKKYDLICSKGDKFRDKGRLRLFSNLTCYLSMSLFFSGQSHMTSICHLSWEFSMGAGSWSTSLNNFSVSLWLDHCVTLWLL